jgi:tetratricopeptide (TPR) repeat protein
MRYGKLLSWLLLALLVFSCANPLKGKPPYWYNGYVYGTRAHQLFCEGKITTALSFYSKALVEAQRHDIPQQAALYHFSRGRCFLELDKNDSAIRCFSEANRNFMLCGSDKEARQAAGFAALAFCGKPKDTPSGLFANDSAFAWYTRGVITPAKTDEKTFWLMVHGRLVWSRDHTKESLAYLDEAYDIYKKEKAWFGAMQMCYCRARVYAYFGDYSEAERMITEALALGDKTPLRFDRWRVLVTAASLYSCKNDAVKANWFFDRMLQCLPDGIKAPARETVLSCEKELFK